MLISNGRCIPETKKKNHCILNVESELFLLVE